MLDSRAWVNTFSTPLDMFVTALFGNDEEGDAPGRLDEGYRESIDNDGQTEAANDSAASRRERRARKQYDWMRKVPGRRYNVYNLDAVDKATYSKNVGILKRSFAGQL